VQADDGGPSFWSSVREAIRGSDQDLTTVPIPRAVLLLAVPTVLEMSMESLLTIVDIFFVSKLGSDAVATVGLTETMLSPVYALAIGLSTGATAMIARSVGRKDLDAAATAAVQVVGIAVAAALGIGIVGGLFARRLLSVLGATETVVTTGWHYTAIMLGGSVTIFLLFVINAIFRAAGDAAIAMRALWIANILNMLLAPLLIFGLHLGVIGAAIAMTGSRAIGVAWQVAMLRRARGRVPIHRRHIVFASAVARELVRIAMPATMQVLIETASWLGLVRIIASYGSVALAGYTIAMRIAIFALLPSWGLSQAAATLVGQNLGAGSADRARRSVHTVVRYNLSFLGPLGLMFMLVPSFFVQFFAEDPATAQHAAECLRIVSIGFVVFAYGMVAVQAFNGAGDSTTPMLVNLASFWFFKIPLAWVLAKVVGFGPRGVFIAITAAYSVQSLLAAWLFRRGRWASTAVTVTKAT
jgi:putative MATE family efflux protein